MENLKAKFTGLDGKSHEILVIAVFENRKIAFISKKDITAEIYDQEIESEYLWTFLANQIHYVHSFYVQIEC